MQLFDAETGALNIVAQRGFPDWWLEYWSDVRRESGSCGTSVEQCTRVVVEDVEQSPIFAGTPALEIQLKAGVRSVQSTPIVSRTGHCFGVFSTHYRTTWRPDAHSERLLDLVARHAAEIIDREYADQQHRENYARFRAVVESPTVGLAQIDRTRKFVFVNDQYCNITGYSRQELLGRMTPFDLDHPDEIEADRKHMMAYLDGRAPTYDREKRYVRKDGRVVWVRVRVAGIRDERGAITATAAIIEDISERKAAVAKLRQSEARYRTLVEQASAITWTSSASGVPVESQMDWVAFTGQNADEVLRSAGWSKAVHPDDVERAVQRWDDAVRGGMPFRSEHRIRRHDGQWRWMRVYAVPIKDGNDSAIEYFGMNFDITDAKEAEARLRAIADYTYDWESWIDPCGIPKWVNPGVERIAGVTTAECLQMKDYPLPLIHPQDRERMRAVFAEAQAGSSGDNVDFRICRPDGEQVSVAIAWQPIASSDGDHMGYRTSVRDITERKKAEEQAALLLAEFNHRAKNLLTVVQSIAQLTAADETPENFYSAFSARLRGLAACQDLLVDAKWTGVSVAALIRSQLPHAQTLFGRRIFLNGPECDVNASAAQAIGMAIHELGTNAAKYGALSTDAGVVDVYWGIVDDAPTQQRRFVMNWRERGGPPVAPPRRQGFGHTVIVEMPEHLLGARVTLSFPHTGVIWALDAPGATIIRPL